MSLLIPSAVNLRDIILRLGLVGLKKAMRISGAALDVVAAVELQASKPISVVEAELGGSNVDVAGELQSLVHSGSVIRVPFIDPFLLGFECYTIGFRVLHEAVEAKYIPLLVRADQVAWVRRHAARGDYSMGIAAPSLGHVVDLFDDFLIGLRGAVTRNHFLVVESWAFYGHKTISRLNVERIPLRVGATHERPRLDELDQRVLRALIPRRHFDPDRVARELRIEGVQLTQSLERLRRMGILRGLTFRIAPQSLGRRRFDILVRRRTADVRVKRDIELFAEEYPQVSVMTNFLGEWDHEITLEIERRAELALFMKTLRSRFGREIERLQWRETVEDLATSNIFP